MLSKSNCTKVFIWHLPCIWLFLTDNGSKRQLFPQWTTSNQSFVYVSSVRGKPTPLSAAAAGGLSPWRYLSDALLHCFSTSADTFRIRDYIEKSIYLRTFFWMAPNIFTRSVWGRPQTDLENFAQIVNRQSLNACHTIQSSGICLIILQTNTRVRGPGGS